MMTSDLIDHLAAAVKDGVIPSPMPGEAMESYKLRAAHAGAVVGARWLVERNSELARAQVATNPEGDTQGRHGDVTTVSPVSPSLGVTNPATAPAEPAPQDEELDLGLVSG